MRIRLPALRTLPSSTVATLSVRPTSAIVVGLPLNENAEVLAATRSPRIFASTSAAHRRGRRKSTRLPLLLRLTNDNTAIDGGSCFGTATATAAIVDATARVDATGAGAAPPDSSRAADRRIPRVAPAQRALVEPHLDTHRLQRVADVPRGLGILRRVAQEDRSRGTAHAGVTGKSCVRPSKARAAVALGRGHGHTSGDRHAAPDSAGKGVAAL